MPARIPALGVLTAMTLSFSSTDPGFTLGASGAVNLAMSGAAGFSVSPAESAGGPTLTITLGGETAEGMLVLFSPGDRLPEKGRYPVRMSWDSTASEALVFHACFLVGSATAMEGFHGESGWVTITGSGAGLVAGEFELEGHAYDGMTPIEGRMVRLRGRFEASATDSR
jgi:hypothetical protein